MPRSPPAGGGRQTLHPFFPFYFQQKKQYLWGGLRGKGANLKMFIYTSIILEFVVQYCIVFVGQIDIKLGAPWPRG